MSKPSIWTEDELKFMRENYAILGTREMSKKLNRTYGSVQVKARRMGLNSRTDIWSDSEIVIIKEVYPIKGVKGVHKLLPHRTEGSIKTRASMLGLKYDDPRTINDAYYIDYILKNYKSKQMLEISKDLDITYDKVRVLYDKIIINGRPLSALDLKIGRYISDKGVNVDFFKKWTPEMAWVLGLITSDGHITPRGVLRLVLHCDDRDCVEKFRDLLAPSKKLTIDRGVYIRCSVFSQEFKKDLECLGIISNKTFVVKPPNVPKEFIRHYIRGLIDGDGSVLYYPDKGKSFYVGFYGNDYMVSYVNKTLNEILGVSLVKQRYRFSSDGCYVSVVSIRYGKKDSFKICDYLYRDVDQSLYMNRKHNSYINALKDYRVIK